MCVFVFAYNKSRLSHDAPHFSTITKILPYCTSQCHSILNFIKSNIDPYITIAMILAKPVWGNSTGKRPI